MVAWVVLMFYLVDFAESWSMKKALQRLAVVVFALASTR